jgi:acyl-CoA synthetase (AMP-forming)/AMP-acid ligase II
MFDIVPSQLMPELQKGKVLVTNWHLFAPESPHAESGRSYTVVNKGEESPEAFARRVLGDLHEHAPLMVLNDEAHHAYRPAPVSEKERLTADDKAEREEATVWISESELREFTWQRLADYKVPELVFFLPVLPKGPTGKVQRRVLRDLARQG